MTPASHSISFIHPPNGGRILGGQPSQVNSLEICFDRGPDWRKRSDFSRPMSWPQSKLQAVPGCDATSQTLRELKEARCYLDRLVAAISSARMKPGGLPCFERISTQSPTERTTVS